MKLQNFKRLLKTDFDKDDQTLVEQLSNSINSGIENLYLALNKRLTIADNIQATEKDVDVVVDANGIPTSSTFANTDFNGQVRNVFVGKADNQSFPGVYPTSAVFISWNNTANGIQLMNVRGIQPGNRYKLRLVMFG